MLKKPRDGSSELFLLRRIIFGPSKLSCKEPLHQLFNVGTGMEGRLVVETGPTALIFRLLPRFALDVENFDDTVLVEVVRALLKHCNL